MLRFLGWTAGIPIYLLLSSGGMRGRRRHLPLLVDLARGPVSSPRAENPGKRDEPSALTQRETGMIPIIFVDCWTDPFSTVPKAEFHRPNSCLALHDAQNSSSTELSGGERHCVARLLQWIWLAPTAVNERYAFLAIDTRDPMNLSFDQAMEPRAESWANHLFHRCGRKVYRGEATSQQLLRWAHYQPRVWEKAPLKHISGPLERAR